ncbi:MAG: class I SAM-dependent methyltransferase [Candidatus Woesearchaeota archaeon]
MNKKVNSKEYYNSISSSYNELYGEEQLEKIKVIKSLLIKKNILKNKGKVIDLGCGSGLSSFWFKEYGYDVFGYDISDNLINIAKEKFPKNNYICFNVDNINHLDFKKDEFDIGISISAIQNFDSPIDVFNEMMRFSKNVIITYPKKINDNKLEFLKNDKRLVFFDCKKDKGYIYTP